MRLGNGSGYIIRLGLGVVVSRDNHYSGWMSLGIEGLFIKNMVSEMKFDILEDFSAEIVARWRLKIDVHPCVHQTVGIKCQSATFYDKLRVQEVVKA